MTVERRLAGGATSRSFPPRLAVGLMAGTSLDGVDAAVVRISGPASQPSVRLLAFLTVPYPPSLRAWLLSVAGGEPVTAGEISELNFTLGKEFAHGALRACRQAGIDPRRLAVIGSHGQTIFHQGRPRPRASTPSTLQIAEPSVISELTGATVVADFRTADLAAGGEGAPLVPLVDYLLLRDAKLGTLALNIGGIANVTVIPAAARAEEVFGFDTGPGNMLMDALVRRFTRGKSSYDRGGQMARRGRILESILARSLRHKFFSQPPPKSAGREQFGRNFLERYFLTGKGSRPEDLVRTANELTAQSVVQALERFVFPELRAERLIVSGGGAHNRVLLDRIRELLPGVAVRRSDECGLPVDAKEAMAFAVLADRTMHGLAGNLPRVTGARRAVVLGKIVTPAHLTQI